MKNWFQKWYAKEVRRIPVNRALQYKLAHDLGLPIPKEGFLARLRNTWSTFVSRPLIPAALALGLFALLFVQTTKPTLTGLTSKQRIDDWQDVAAVRSERAFNYAQPKMAMPSMTGAGVGVMNMQALDIGAAPMVASDRALGFAVGGAKDIANFRQNIEKNFLPLPTDVTYEGIFYDYMFDTGNPEACAALFCPTWSRAVTRAPDSGATEYYVAVGLHSGLKESDVVRKKTNFVVVLDTSGSMSELMDAYYYDGLQNPVPGTPTQETREPRESMSKMRAASEALQALVDELRADDRLGVVLYNDDAWMAKPLRRVDETDLGALKKHVSEIQADGSTNMSSGIDLAEKMLEEGRSEGYESRVIFLTDAMPNQGDFGSDGLKARVERNADRGIFMTFLGIGVDFQTELIETITKARGANYYAIHNADAFRKRLGEEFDDMVTPLVFDLKLEVAGDGFEIERVYGAPEADRATGTMMQVKTLFPSKTTDAGVKGGVVLVKLKKTGAHPRLALKTSYEDRNGKRRETAGEVNFDAMNEDSFDSSGVRKAVLLTRYVNLLKEWIDAERRTVRFDEREVWNGMPNRKMPVFQGSMWGRGSRKLTISPAYAERFKSFLKYFEKEAIALGDTALTQEIDVMQKLAIFPVANGR